MATKRVLILGSTGSIGTQTVDALRVLNAAADQGRSEDRFEIVGLAAGSNAQALAEQAQALGVQELALRDTEVACALGARRGADAAEMLVREVDADVVVASIVGLAGLGATLAAVELGREVALANKETLVAAGPLVVEAASRSGARLFPIDSEHAAAWQCLSQLPGCSDSCPLLAPPPSLSRLTITASGGAFRTADADTIASATPDQALAHPTWSMGAKVTIDSATLINKALELIEARWLFDLGPDRLGAVVHPQSTVHAFAELTDGSVIAQLAAPDMRVAIAQAISGGRVPHTLGLDDAPAPLDLARLGSLDFEPIDTDRFPGFTAWEQIARLGGTSGACFNAANEAAVEGFLQRRFPFGRIAHTALEALEAHETKTIRGLDDVLEADAEGRAFVAEAIGSSV
ncbi:MAG: 1-deoxy-D-xylulose-5-phosphate reductoisomerase [Planctomycetota bacterium]